MKVMIIEDEFIQRRFLQVLLEKAGHEVLIFSNGRQGWEALQRENVRMLITDWIMPEMDGPELICRIRCANWPDYTYILMLTSKDNQDSVTRGLEAGADDYLFKPFDQAEMIARLALGERVLNLEARLHELATHDYLTGAFNRTALVERLRAELEQAAGDGAPTSLVCLDLDYFKSINDSLGHAAGDQALRQVAEMLAAQAPGRAALGRWGGAKFLMLLPHTALDQAVEVAESLRAQIAAMTLHLTDGRPVQLTASLGVSCTSLVEGPSVLDALLHRADEALQRAKTEGRNRVCWSV